MLYELLDIFQLNPFAPLPPLLSNPNFRRSSIASLDSGGSGSSVNVVALCELVNNANGVDPVAAESALRGVILLAGMDTIQRLSLGKYGACRAAVGALEHFPEDAAVAASACAAIMNLAFESNNEMMLGMEGACKAVVKALARHPGDRQVQVEGWGAVVNLASINIERFLAAGVCEVVTSSMRTLATGAIDDGWVEPVMAELLIALLTVCGHSSSLVELGKSGVCEALVDMLGFYNLGVDDTSVDAEGGDDPFGNAAVMPETGRFKWDAADFTARGTDSTDNTAAPATTNTDTNPDNNASTDTDANTEPPRRWPFSEILSRLGCRALAALSEHAPNRARLANAEAVRHAVFALVALHGRSEELRSDALNCMINLVQECSCTEELAAPPPAVDHRGGGGECDAIEHSGGGGGVGGGGVCATTCARVDAMEAGGLEAVSVAMSAAPNDPLVQRQASIAVILMCTGNGAIKRRLVVEASGTGADSSGMRQRSSTTGTRASVTTHAQFVAELAARVEASGVLTCVVAALQGHPTDLRIVEAACMALAAAAELSPSVARALNKLDACTALGAAMRAYPENDLIQDHSVRALLPVLSHGRGELAKWKVAASVELLCGVTLAALERFMDVPDMQECILNVISELAHTSEAHRACIHTIGIAERLVYSMRARVSHIAIQKSASVAIANLCVFDSSTAGDSKADSTIKEGVREALVSCGACEAVVAAIRQYSTDRELLLLAYPALWHLAEEDVTTIGRLRAIETQELVAQVRTVTFYLPYRGATGCAVAYRHTIPKHPQPLTIVITINTTPNLDPTLFCHGPRGDGGPYHHFFHALRRSRGPELQKRRGRHPFHPYRHRYGHSDPNRHPNRWRGLKGTPRSIRRRLPAPSEPGLACSLADALDSTDLPVAVPSDRRKRHHAQHAQRRQQLSCNRSTAKSLDTPA